MEKEDLLLLAQLLHTMQEIAEEMRKYEKRKDYEKLNSAKKELMQLQRRVSELIG